MSAVAAGSGDVTMNDPARSQRRVGKDLGGMSMPRFAAWAFGEDAEFDGRGQFAEAISEDDRAVRAGTLELTFTPSSVHRATLVSCGVPGRDVAGFAVSLGHAGAISLCGTDRSGKPLRLASKDGLVSEGETVQVTLSWRLGYGGTFTTVNLSRLKTDPDSPEHGFVAQIPLRASISASGRHALVFGAAAGGAAPYFHGRIHRAALSDSFDAPSVAAPSAKILRPAFGKGPSVTPRRVPPPQPLRPREGALRRPATETLVTTADGPKPIRDISIGDEVMTRDHGLQVVRWTGLRDLDWSELRSRPHLKPVVIRKGALAPGRPERDLSLARHERLSLPKGEDLKVTLEGRPEEIEAHALLGQRGVFEVEALGVSYVHLLFDQHEMIETNGIWIEAHHPGALLRPGEGPERRREILDIFPELDVEHHGARMD